MPEKMPGSGETFDQYKKRAEEATGLTWDQIPDGVPDDMLGGQILAKFDKWVVVTHSYPDREDSETGEKFWDPKPENFRKIDTTM